MFAKQCSHSNPRRLHLSPRCGSRPPSSVESDHVPARCARHRSASDPLLPRIHGTSLRPGTACGGCNMTWPDCMSRTINKKAPSMCQIICIIFFASISHIWNRFDAILSIFNVHGFSHGICLRLTSNQTSASWMAPTHPTHLDLQLCLGEPPTCQGTPLLALLQHLVLMQLHSLFLPGAGRRAQGTSRDSNPSSLPT